MKTSHKTKKKTASPKHHRAQVKTEAHNTFEKVNTDVKNWGSTISHRFLSNYAIPFTRLVEAKLISLQAKV